MTTASRTRTNLLRTWSRPASIAPTFETLQRDTTAKCYPEFSREPFLNQRRATDEGGHGRNETGLRTDSVDPGTKLSELCAGAVDVARWPRYELIVHTASRNTKLVSRLPTPKTSLFGEITRKE